MSTEHLIQKNFLVVLNLSLYLWFRLRVLSQRALIPWLVALIFGGLYVIPVELSKKNKNWKLQLFSSIPIMVKIRLPVATFLIFQFLRLDFFLFDFFHNSFWTIFRTSVVRNSKTSTFGKFWKSTTFFALEIGV